MTVQVRKFTPHFVVRWGQRVGGLPSIEAVNDLIADSICIQRQQLLWRRVGETMEKYRVPSLFWHHGAGIVIMVDEYKALAKTIYSPDMYNKYSKAVMSDED